MCQKLNKILKPSGHTGVYCTHTLARAQICEMLAAAEKKKKNRKK